MGCQRVEFFLNFRCWWNLTRIAIELVKVLNIGYMSRGVCYAEISVIVEPPTCDVEAHRSKVWIARRVKTEATE